MRMLEELWNGNVAFGNRPVRAGSKLEDRLALYARNDRVMKELLSDSQLEQYTKTMDSFNESVAQSELEAFEIGFTVAARLMIDVMQTIPLPDLDD